MLHSTKIKDTKSGATKFQYLGKCGKPVPKPSKCGAQSGVVDTQIFLRPPPYFWVNHRHSLTLNTNCDFN